jgi:predicted nucleic acid-binding protein
MNETDQYHDLAVEQYKAIVANGYSLVLTTYVIAETHALLLNTTRNAELGRRWLLEVAFEDFTVVRPGEREEEQALQLLTTHTDKLWSFVDALSFTVMETLAIPYFFSFDEDFHQRGKFIDIIQCLNEK